MNPPKSELHGYSKETEVTFLPMESIGENGFLVLAETKRLEFHAAFADVREDKMERDLSGAPEEVRCERSLDNSL